MIKTSIVSSFEDFKLLVKKIQERRIPQVLGLEPDKQEYYRGQSRDIDSYKLKPSISRKIANVNDLKRIELAIFEDLKSLFSRNSGYVRVSPPNYHHFNDWELLWQAQHFEIPTRLMDWTQKFEVALFFATGYSHNDAFDGQFWVFSVENKYQDIGNSYLDFNPFDFQKTILLNPDFNDHNDYNTHFGEIRRLRQYGKFLFQSHENSLIPLEEQEEIFPFLEKYIIPKEKKPIIRQKLFELDFFKEKLIPSIEDNMRAEIGNILNKHNI